MKNSQLSGVCKSHLWRDRKNPSTFGGKRSQSSRSLGWFERWIRWIFRTVPPFCWRCCWRGCIMNVCGFLLLAQNISRINRNQNICSKTFEVSGPKPSTKHHPPTKEEPYQYTPTTWSWKLGQRGHEEDLGEVKMKKKQMCKMECCWIILLNNSLMYQTSSCFCSIEFLSIADFRVGYPPLLGGSKQRSLCSGRLGIIPKASIFRCMFYLSGDGRTFQSNLVQNHPIKKLDLIYCL